MKVSTWPKTNEYRTSISFKFHLERIRCSSSPFQEMNRSQIGDNSTNWSQAKPSHGWTYNISKTRTPTVCHQHLQFFCYYGKPASADWYIISPVCYWKGILMCRKPLVRTAVAHLALKKEWWFGVIQSHSGYPATKHMIEFLFFEPVVLSQVLKVQRYAQVKIDEWVWFSDR